MSVINVTNISVTFFEKIQNKVKIFVHCYSIIDVYKMAGSLLACCREKNMVARAYTMWWCGQHQKVVRLINDYLTET